MLSDKAVRVSVYLSALLIIGCAVLVGVNVSLAGTVNLPKTGQTTCYDTAGSVISCIGTGQDGNIQAGVEWPNPRFTDNGDGTMTNNLTGLMWLKSGNCFGAKTWAEALDAVAALNASPGSYTCGGYTGTYNDWVLPNVNELESLVNAEDSDPATWLNGQGFLNVQSSDYWSSTTYVSISSYKWFVDMDTGVSFTHSDYYTNIYYVWAVRAGQSQAYPAPVWRTGQTTSYAAGDDGALQRGVEWPNPRFTDNGDGTVTDNLTGLTWLKDASCFGLENEWQEALDSVTDFNVNPGGYSCTWYTASYNNWRLPNRKELRSLIDYSMYRPVLQTGYPFVNVEDLGMYCSSSTDASFTDKVWTMHLQDGEMDDKPKSMWLFMWPVRGGIDNPTVTTAAVSSITSSSASSGGNVTSGGGASVSAKGVCWSTSANPTVSNSKTTDGTGTGSFTSSITGLNPSTTYHVRAYATNSGGTGYGSDISFTTSAAPTTTTTSTSTTSTTTTTLPLPSCPECSSSPVVLTGITFGSDTACECSDATSITIGSGVTIESGANITFKAPMVKIQSGFHAEEGSTVRIKQE